MRKLQGWGDKSSKRVNTSVEQERIDLSLVNNCREKYVVFRDLLGFSELVEKIGQHVLERRRGVEVLNRDFRDVIDGGQFGFRQQPASQHRLDNS